MGPISLEKCQIKMPSQSTTGNLKGQQLIPGPMGHVRVMGGVRHM